MSCWNGPSAAAFQMISFAISELQQGFRQSYTLKCRQCSLVQSWPHHSSWVCQPVNRVMQPCQPVTQGNL